MSCVVIRAENLSKRYAIGHGPHYRTLRDALANVASVPFRALRSRGNGRNGTGKDFVWALKEVSFEVRQGEIVGIIGRNGAGKSTLLKILSRITDPTAGQAEIRGRVGSLLEVGTGFHPELTGRENVFLNGAILGMRKQEIARKFDEIVDFAEVEKFIDTPVKHYSSGMYMRLAFAVAAHMNTEVLLVDEVLAVGDARFWSKCMDKVRSLNQQGVTIVLVTHNMWQVQTACSRAFCLESGDIRYDGKPTDAIGFYEGMLKHIEAKEFDKQAIHSQSTAAITDLRIEFFGPRVTNGNAQPDSGMRVFFGAKVPPHRRVKLLVRITNPTGFPYFGVFSDPACVGSNGRIIAETQIARLMLMPGKYLLWGEICDEADTRQLLTNASIPFEVHGDVQQTEALFWNTASWRVRVENGE